MTDYILGLDLAGGLSGAAIAPVDWGGDWDKVTTVTAGYPLPKKGSRARVACDENRAQWEGLRAYSIAKDICSIVSSFSSVSSCNRVLVYTETMFVGANQSAVIPIAYVRGAVLTLLVDRQATLHDVSANEWRKLLLGSASGLRQEVKAATKRTLVASGAPESWCEDEFDAAAVMNWGMAQHGGQFYSSPQPVKL